MSSNVKVLFVLLAICSVTLQSPFFIRDNYKGLNGLMPLPRAQLYSSEIIRRAVYFHDQTVAVVDINSDNEMQNCDIIEVYEPREANEVLSNLSFTSRPAEVTFTQMTSLMYRCDLLDNLHRSSHRKSSTRKGPTESISMTFSNAINLFFSGIIPDTKWCGTGDIAENYHDLGTDVDVDRCCRTHDLCPVKIRGNSSRYNLTNYDLYSKSHCDCDNAFYHCLKNVESDKADLMGKLYFNVIEVICIDEESDNLDPITCLPNRKFARPKLSF